MIWKLHRILASFIIFIVITPAIAAPINPEIRITDVSLFYRVYDAAGGKPSGSILQRDYIGAGTDGVRQFVPGRIISGDELAKMIAAYPSVYQDARTCVDKANLPEVKLRTQAARTKLGKLLPDAKFPPVTILVGRNSAGGTTGLSGVIIGIELVCRSDWLQPALDDRLFHLITHEYIHVQQPSKYMDGSIDKPTLLQQSLLEGVAEFIGEMISGEVSSIKLQHWTAGHEKEIETAFLKEKDSTDLSHWLYNGPGTPEKPGDLGYWVGYRIAKQYYERAPNKAEALARLVQLDDPEAILKESGWIPGQALSVSN